MLQRNDYYYSIFSMGVKEVFSWLGYVRFVEKAKHSEIR